MLLGAQGKKGSMWLLCQIKVNGKQISDLYNSSVETKASYKLCYSLANNSYYCLGSHRMCCCCWPVMGAKKLR